MTTARPVAVSLTPSAGGGRDVSVRGFLTRLHKTRAYLPSVDARWQWAVVVDVMAVAIVVWALTGVVMWAQTRVPRGRAGVGMFITLTR